MMEIQHCGIAQPKHVQIKKQTCGKTCVCQRCPNLFISMFKIFFLFSTTDLYRYLSKSQKSPLNLPWVYSIHFRLESNFHLEPWIWNSFRDNQSSPVSCSNSTQHPKQLHLLSLFPVVDFKINRVSSKPQKIKTRVGWDSDSWVLVFFKKKKRSEKKFLRTSTKGSLWPVMSCWSDLGWYSALEKLRPRRVSDTLNPPALLTDSNYRNQIRSHAALRALRKNRYHDLCACLVWCITWFRVFQTCPHWEGWKPSSPGFDLQLGCICGPLLNNRCCTQNKDPFQVPIWQSQKMLLSFIFWRVIKKKLLATGWRFTYPPVISTQHLDF